MKKFKVGDRVKIIKMPSRCGSGVLCSGCKKYIGQIGTITEFSEITEGTITVKFKNMRTYCSGFTEEVLELVGKEPVKVFGICNFVNTYYK